MKDRVPSSIRRRCGGQLNRLDIMQRSGTWGRTYLTKGAIALAVLGVPSFLIAVSYQDLTLVAANSGAILVAGSYLCGLCVAWIDGRPIPCEVVAI